MWYYLFQITWARQLFNANTSYQILTVGDSTYVDDSRFLVEDGSGTATDNVSIT